MSIEGLKEQARRHEQKEEWKQALETYQRAIHRLAEEDQPDVGLYNRVGDICVRLGQLDKATTQYEQAVALYVEAELPNNAIAVCKKIIRNMPGRSSVYLSMGRIKAKQGFLTDARQNFLTYAERVQAAGNMEEALRALEELADLSPADVELRISLAQNLQQHGRGDEALEQLRAAHGTLTRAGNTDRAEAIMAQARQIDPSADFTVPAAPEQQLRPAASREEPAGVGSDFGEIVIAESAAPSKEKEKEAEPASSDFAQEWAVFSMGEEEKPGSDRPGFSPGAAEPEEEEEAEPLPFLSMGEEEEEEAEPLPMLALDEEGEEEDVLSAAAFGESDRDERELSDALAETPELDVSLSFGSEREAKEAVPTGSAARREEAVEQAVFDTRAAPSKPEELIAAGDLEGAERMLRDLMAEEPTALAHRQLLVEVAYRQGNPRAQADAYVELAKCLERNGSGEQASGVYRQVLQLDPENPTARAALGGGQRPTAPAAASVASSEDYVDLGSLIFDDDEEEKTTRFTVSYEEPSGDENADFARMLDQFKAKIAENVGADDVQAHHDLGTAYKEMGLIDEAIREFQAALRASREHLPTYELLGQCFLDNGQPEAAIKSLTRALSFPVGVEDELLGIYYYLGRAYEATGNKDSAMEFYDRVFSLDINFLDVTDRLRSLR
jgi:tetratricopeptide (TPR) repeat protein